jgi:hypothetical protein
VSRFGGLCLRPERGTELPAPERPANKTADFVATELSERLANGPEGSGFWCSISWSQYLVL